MTLGQQLSSFLSDPIVIAPLLTLVVLAIANFLFAIYRTIQDGTFDSSRLPQVLDTLVLRKVFPLCILGIAIKATASPEVAGILVTAYAGLSAASIAAEVRQLVDNAQNKRLPDIPMEETKSQGEHIHSL